MTQKEFPEDFDETEETSINNLEEIEEGFDFEEDDLDEIEDEPEWSDEDFQDAFMDVHKE